MFRTTTLVTALALVIAGACTAGHDRVGQSDQAIAGMADLDAGSGATTADDDDNDPFDLEIEAAPVDEPPAVRTGELTPTEEVALWGEPARGDSAPPCYPEGSCDMLSANTRFANTMFADALADPPANDATCDKPAKTISAYFDNRSGAAHVQNATDHIYRLTGNVQASYVEGCDNDFPFQVCENRTSHGSTHKVAVKAWCVKNPYWDPTANPAKCLPKIAALPAEEYKWGDAGVHKHRWARSRATCAWLRGDPDMGAKYCNVMPKSSVEWKPEHTISLRVNGVPVDIVNSWNVGLGGANAATHAGGGVQIGTFMSYGPAGFFAHVAESPANTWYTAKVENAIVACDDQGNVVETRDRSKSMDPIETR